MYGFLLVTGLIIGLVICLVFGSLASGIAERKGYSTGGFFLLGFLFGLIGLVIALCMPDIQGYEEKRSSYRQAQPTKLNREPTKVEKEENIWYCKKCGKANWSSEIYCSSCRTRRMGDEKWLCGKCGKVNSGDVGSCPVCGKKKIKW